MSILIFALGFISFITAAYFMGYKKALKIAVKVLLVIIGLILAAAVIYGVASFVIVLVKAIFKAVAGILAALLVLSSIVTPPPPPPSPPPGSKFCPFSNKETCGVCPVIKPSDNIRGIYFWCPNLCCYVDPNQEPAYNNENRKYK